jgi:hypothetical protein
MNGFEELYEIIDHDPWQSQKRADDFGHRIIWV